MKKLLNQLFSMKVAVAILILLIIACVAGSIIPQGAVESVYLEQYSENIVRLIRSIGLDDVFHSWWFIILTAALCISLLGCNLMRFTSMIKMMKSYKIENFIKDEAVATVDENPEELFKKMGFTHLEKKDETIYSIKNRIGVWGAWLTHLGILIIIVGFAIGQMTTVKYTVYGVVGQTLFVEDTNYQLTINDFNVNLREDQTVEQYISNITVTNTANGENETGDASVNYPANLLGFKVYQNSTGWAAHINFLNGEQLLQSEVVCAGEYMAVNDLPGLYVLFRSFYPDYVIVDGQPMTASGECNNPAYLYMVYYHDQMIGMNILNNDYISLTGPNDEDFRITFTDPEKYTLLQLKKDNSTFIVLVGGLVTLFALFIAFYMQTSEMFAEKGENGWKVYVKSRKGNILIKDKLALIVSETGKE